MMKKGILYIVTAVLLGIALTLTPRLFLSTSGAFQQPFAEGGGFYNAQSKDAFSRNEMAYGITPQPPSDEISAGLMSIFSLVLAFAVFRQSKKKTV